MAEKTKAKPAKPGATKLLDSSTNVQARDITHVEVENPPVPLTAEQQGQKEIEKFNLAREWITTKKLEYSLLKINGVDDKVGYKAVESAWQTMRNKRLAVEKKHKELKADYIVITRLIDGEKNDLTGLLKEGDGGEDWLGKQLDAIENIKKEEAARIEREAQEKLQGRVNELIGKGMAFNGSYYAIGDNITIDVVTLKSMNDEVYGQLCTRVDEAAAGIKKEKERIEREEQEERERMAAAKKKNDEDALLLQQAQDKLKKDREELENQKQELLRAKVKARAGTLEALGMKHDYQSSKWKFGTIDFGRVEVILSEVIAKSDEDWTTYFEQTKVTIADMKQKQEAKDAERAAEEKAEQEAEDKKQKELTELRQRTALRVSVLENKFKMVDCEGGHIRESRFNNVENVLVDRLFINNQSPEEWDKTLKRLEKQIKAFDTAEAAIRDAIALKKEKARTAALNDVQRFEEWILAMQAIPVPAVENADIKETIQNIQNAMTGTVVKTKELANKL